MSAPLRTDQANKTLVPGSSIATGSAGKRAVGKQNGRWSAYKHLLLARTKEMQREPEVIFWVFLFPLLLAFGLGIAFRSRPTSVPNVAIAASPGANAVLEMAQRPPQPVHAQIVPEAEALNGFRLGRYDLVILPGEGGSLQYRYDPARPESVLARAQVDEALQSAAGRRNPVPTSARASSEPGARYIDFLIPGLLGMNLMNSGMWGVGFALVDYRQRKLLKRYVATPMRRSDFLLALTSSRLVLMIVEL
jgi:ABC-2 type transport system permease protein